MVPEQKGQRVIIRPEPHVFADYANETFEQNTTNVQNEAVRRMMQQKTTVYITQGVKYPDTGIKMYYKGLPDFPRQGFVFPEAVDCVNNLKRVTMFFLALFRGKGIKGKIGNALGEFVRIADWMFQFYDPNSDKIRKIYLQEYRYRQSVRELIKLINLFLKELNIIPRSGGNREEVIKIWGKDVGEMDFGRTIGTMIEYDNAYHWRMEDIFSETTKEKLLKNPRKELKRLLQIYKQREGSGIEIKADGIVKLLNWILLIPSVKKAFRNAVKQVNIENLGMTKEDSYYTMNYEGYDFKGKPIEERNKIWLEMTNGVPPERVTIQG